MSRIGTTTNLPTGSTYDLLLVQTPDGFPKSQITFQFSNVPRKIEGLQKVAQCFLKILFTTKGSDPLRQTHGTAFPYLVISANKQYNDREFEMSLMSAIIDAESQTKAMLNGSKYDSASQLSKIVFLGVNSVADSLSLYLQMVTVAGEQASISVPFPSLDLKLSNG